MHAGMLLDPKSLKDSRSWASGQRRRSHRRPEPVPANAPDLASLSWSWAAAANPTVPAQTAAATWGASRAGPRAQAAKSPTHRLALVAPAASTASCHGQVRTASVEAASGQPAGMLAAGAAKRPTASPTRKRRGAA